VCRVCDLQLYLLCFYLFFSFSLFFIHSLAPFAFAPSRLTVARNHRKRSQTRCLSRRRFHEDASGLSERVSPFPSFFPRVVLPRVLRSRLCSILHILQKRSSDPPRDTRLECIRVHKPVRTRRSKFSLSASCLAASDLTHVGTLRRNDIPSAYNTD